MLPGFVYLREKLSGGNLSHIMTGDADTGKGGVDNAALRDIVEAYNCHLLWHLVASEPQGLDSSDCNQVIVRPLSIIASISAIAPSMVGESWWMIQRERDIPLSWTA